MGSIINRKGEQGAESARVEVGGTAVWDYTAGTEKIKEIKKIDFFLPRFAKIKELNKIIFFAPSYGPCSQRKRGTLKPSAPAYELCFNKEKQKKYWSRRPRRTEHAQLNTGDEDSVHKPCCQREMGTSRSKAPAHVLCIRRERKTPGLSAGVEIGVYGRYCRRYRTCVWEATSSSPQRIFIMQK
jgi:hypothetical protein